MIVSEEEVLFRSSVATCSDSMVTQQAGWASVEMMKEEEDFRRDEEAEEENLIPLSGNMNTLA